MTWYSKIMNSTPVHREISGPGGSDKIYIEEAVLSENEVFIGINDLSYGIYLDRRSGVDAALGILEALGYNGGSGYANNAVDLLRAEMEVYAKKDEEASLRSEAKRIYEAVNPVQTSIHGDWEGMTDTAQKKWIKIAKAARELHKGTDG